MIDTIAIKYYNGNLSESVTHLEISIFANEVNGDLIWIVLEDYFVFRFVNKY